MSRYGPPLVALLASFVLSSCMPTEPRHDLSLHGNTILSSPWAQGVSLFYPLDVGNHWEYQNDLVLRFTPSDPTLPPEVQNVGSTIQVDLTGTEDHSGRTYVVQRETDGSYESSFLYRQDKSGLYSLDSPPAQVARARVGSGVEALFATSIHGSESARDAVRAAVAGVMQKQAAIRRYALGSGSLTGPFASGPFEGEISVLRYPLAASKTWHLREDPLFVYTVERQEGLDLPAGTFSGWRIRIDSSLFGPADVVHVWYGRDGLLQLQAHVEGQAVDENGNVLGTVVSEQSERMTVVSLVGAGL